MAQFEFECPEGHRWIALQRKQEEDGSICPNCGSPGRKLISACNYSFGWRLTESSHIRGNPDELERNI